MDDDAELIKAAATGAVNAIVEPFNSLLTDLLGPAAEEAGEYLRWRVQVFRESRMKRFTERTKAIFAERQKRPEPVPLKMLLPIIEAASVEEDDELQDRWAALLVSCSGERRITVPAAPEILKQLNNWEVMLLQRCFDSFSGDMEVLYPYPQPWKRPMTAVVTHWWGDLRVPYGLQSPGLTESHDFAAMLGNLERLGLLEKDSTTSRTEENEKRVEWLMTSLGFKFVSLCQP